MQYQKGRERKDKAKNLEIFTIEQIVQGEKTKEGMTEKAWVYNFNNIHLNQIIFQK